jgi:hypothetical protein
MTVRATACSLPPGCRPSGDTSPGGSAAAPPRAVRPAWRAAAGTSARRHWSGLALMVHWSRRPRAKAGLSVMLAGCTRRNRYGRHQCCGCDVLITFAIGPLTLSSAARRQLPTASREKLAKRRKVGFKIGEIVDRRRDSEWARFIILRSLAMSRVTMTALAKQHK